MIILVKALYGTTSAHAENTDHAAWFRGESGNYLRARGEYSPAPGLP